MVQEIGASAGFAAALGLAVLSALYLSQAREVKRLKEWAGRAPEHSGRGLPAAPGITRRRSRAWYGRMGTRHVAVALVSVLVFGGAAAYGLTQPAGDEGGDDSGNVQARDDTGSLKKPGPNSAAVTPRSVTVAVLNGTTVPGLAATLRDRIAAAGFKKGAINNFSDQQLAQSVVQYAPGRQAEATAVSRTLGITRREPVTAISRALAGEATVIVIAGADKTP